VIAIPYIINCHKYISFFATRCCLIIAPPEIMPFQPSSNLKEGGKTNIVCSVTSGDLPITFVWRKDGKPLPHDSDIHEHVMDMSSTLRINNLAAKHSGHYMCIATNPASSANFTAKLIVKGKRISLMGEEYAYSVPLRIRRI